MKDSLRGFNMCQTGLKEDENGTEEKLLEEKL